MNQFGAAPLLLAVILLFPPCVPAQVTLSFDNDLEGFTATTGGIDRVLPDHSGIGPLIEESHLSEQPLPP